MGINAEREITSHGLAINCNTDMKWFGNIVPCGIVDKGMFLIPGSRKKLNHGKFLDTRS